MWNITKTYTVKLINIEEKKFFFVVAIKVSHLFPGNESWSYMLDFTYKTQYLWIGLLDWYQIRPIFFFFFVKMSWYKSDKPIQRYWVLYVERITPTFIPCFFPFWFQMLCLTLSTLGWDFNISFDILLMLNCCTGMYFYSIISLDYIYYIILMFQHNSCLLPLTLLFQQNR
jgi:hypothetical protein